MSQFECPTRWFTRRAAACAAMAVAAAVLALRPSAARADGELFTPYHVARIRTVTAAKMSPDGTRIAYLLSVPREPWASADGNEDAAKDGNPWSELHVVDLHGASRPFVTGEVNVGAIDWTPDGKAISFLSKRGHDEHQSLYVIPIDGGEARRVLAHDTDVAEYSWSPDGREVAFVATEKEDKARKKEKDKGFSQEIYEEEERPSRVWIAPVDVGGGARPARPKSLELPGSASVVRWSPTGDRLAVALAPTPLIDDEYMNRKIHVLNAESGEVVGRIETPGKIGDFAWSPDGAHIALMAGADRNDPAEGAVMMADASGGPVRNVVPEDTGHVNAIAWQSADTIMYLRDEGAQTALGKINVDGSDRKTIVAAERHVLAGLTLSKDGQSGAMLNESPTHPPEVFTMRHGDDGPRRLTDSNPWLAKMRFAKQEFVRHTARDGLALQGLLIRPLDEEPGQRYPLIIYVHGGPESHERHGWLTNYSRPGQVAAARGFAVFYANYRGSTGRGIEYSKLDQADYGGKEFDDLVDAADHLIAAGLVDKDKVGVTGGSYGGYASAWCATYLTKRFAAAVMFVGVSDWVSKSGTTDIPNEMYLVHARRLPWEHWDWFRERSPIYHTPQARTPILILHGKDDTRVHPSQSLELYRYLKMQGNVPVRLVWYPGEGHGNRRAASRLDYNLRMIQWFEHYLKGPGGEPPPYEMTYDIGEADDAGKDEKSAARSETP